MDFLCKLFKIPLYSKVKLILYSLIMVGVVAYVWSWFLDLTLTSYDVISSPASGTVFSCIGPACVKALSYLFLDKTNFALDDPDVKIFFDKDTFKYELFLRKVCTLVFSNAWIIMVLTSVWDCFVLYRLKELRAFCDVVDEHVIQPSFRRILEGLLHVRYLGKRAVFAWFGLLHWVLEAALFMWMTIYVYNVTEDMPYIYTSPGWSSVNRTDIQLEHEGGSTATLMFFPTVSKCQVRVVLPCGSVDTQRALCYHHLNEINAFVYYNLLGWFTFLMTIYGARFVFHNIFLMDMNVRTWVLLHHVPLNRSQMNFVQRWTHWELFTLYRLADDINTKLVDIIILYVYKVFKKM